MIRIGLAALLALSSVEGLAGAQEPAAPPPSPVGLLGHWKADDAKPADGALDGSGQGRKGAYSAGAGVSAEQRAPIKDANPGSFDLDGKTGVITIPDDPALRRSGDFTLSFWKRKTGNVADWVRIVGKGGGGTRNFGLWEHPGEGGQLKYQQYSSGGQSILELDSGPMPSLNTWHHVVCTTSVNACGLYIDGKPVAFGRRTGDPAIAPDPLTFGHAGYHGFFPGQIDDVRLYDRCLSMSEIDYLASGKGAPEPPSEPAFKDGALTWKASPTPAPLGTLTYYSVKRSKTAGSGHQVVAPALTSTSFVDASPEKGEVFYVITALNSGGESLPTAELKVAR